MTDVEMAEYMGIRKESMGTWERIPKNIKALIRNLILSKIAMEEDLAAVIGNTNEGRLFLMDFGATRDATPIPADTPVRFLLNPETDAYLEVKTNGEGVELRSSKKIFICPRTANIADIKIAMGLGFDGTQSAKKKGGRPRAASNA